MINVDYKNNVLHIEGDMETCICEWMKITRTLYTSTAKHNDITMASLLFSNMLVEACKKGAEDLED